MKFTLNWLKDYLDFDTPVKEVVDRLTMLGLEVDSVEQLHQDLVGIKKIRSSAFEGAGQRLVHARQHELVQEIGRCELAARRGKGPGVGLGLE